MAKRIVEESSLIKVADAIRAKTGTTEKIVFPDGFEEAVNNIQAGGSDGSAEDGIITKTLSGSYTNSRVSTIARYAFQDFSTLTYVNFPACTDIGTEAFYNCTSLTDISFPACTDIKSSAFGNCYSLANANFPACKTIGGSAFVGCTSLTNADFPICEIVETSAFIGCASLANASFPACTTIGNAAFCNCISLTDISFPACTTINSAAFGGCTSLYNADFPACTDIKSSVFYSCYSLANANFPACSTIGTGAFCYCSSLTSVSFPVCSTIGINAFIRCTSLTSVSFPSCTDIGTGAFSCCFHLTDIDFPICKSIYNYAFDACSSLTDISFPACSTIGSYAFNGCRGLISANFPTCTTIGAYAFSFCSLLTDISFPACKTIYGSAFYNCYSLKDVSFPVCTSIGSSAFNNCSNLKTIRLSASSMCYLASSRAFASTGITYSKGNIFVPFSLVSTYKANSIWKYYSSIIDCVENFYVEDVKDLYILYNETINKSLALSLKNGVDTPSVGITSTDDTIVSVDNIQVTSENISFDIVSYSVEGSADITITVSDSSDMQVRTFKANVRETIPTISYTVEPVSGATYTFALNENDYYESQNKNKSNSYAICKVNIVAERDCIMHVDCINYAEAEYDYGILSTLDNTLKLSYTADSANVKKTFKGESSSNIQTISYDIPEGNHFIYIKFFKDSSGNTGNDSLQFKIRLE